ncbi:monosaccharide ABC transporter ATP-binding protein, CUT2 family [Geosporobacter subterraneus DSM 17957]|uniref:Monosaccharide ABC transporter ATP-binding protein, CUT2 family n=1 Tax=Geosporobacter subterraneus DSM 17957 TaxID=1121919 RepID=A0A1M6NYN5_9FIRM|nr:sugar ABC transporter ATP-binding protein [Geosporobacter subterraneus]SHK00796.1 monosaccharide ABC transporter ATP-binding protein, CUT2 family [Geosporobacter subterraneus DSM 17957]
MDNFIVKLENVCKSFPGVRALDNVSFHLKSGEVLALLGENGAGKSTLMKILSGVYTRDKGTMEIFGESIEDMNPVKAHELGIAIIHQELNMCDHLTVAQNIFLGREVTKNGILSDKEMNEEAGKILRGLNMDIDPETIVGDLSISKQQMVEIAKALSTNAKILIMDEPTSALTSKEIDDLFAIIKRLKHEGCGIVYISHRLEELQYIVDRVMILRDGQYITSMDFKDTNLKEIISYMVGREITEKFPRIHRNVEKKILEVKNLNAGKMVRDISFSLYEGEIVGIAGLMGAGRTETTRALFGVDPKESGEIIIDGKSVKINKPIDAIQAGIVLVPENRKKDGLCTKLSIRDNIALPNLDIIASKLGVVNRKKEEEITKSSVENLAIRLANAEVDADSLSGGNQQKVVVGKWLVRNSRVVIFDEPTRGIDVASKVEIYNLMNQLKSQGIGVLFVSSEMPEVLGISDRILVMADGRITKELDIQEATQDIILEYATKFEKKIKENMEA